MSNPILAAVEATFESLVPGLSGDSGYTEEIFRQDTFERIEAFTLGSAGVRTELLRQFGDSIFAKYEVPVTKRDVSQEKAEVYSSKPVTTVSEAEKPAVSSELEGAPDLESARNSVYMALMNEDPTVKIELEKELPLAETISISQSSNLQAQKPLSAEEGTPYVQKAA
jgi:hypothetical protein